MVINNKLYLGDGDQAQNEDIINDIGITHIINMTKEISNKFEYDHKFSSSLKYLRCKILDDVYTDIDQYFDKCIIFIDNALKQDVNNRVLVHCVAGISRSSSIIIAYLMKMKNIKFDIALEYTQNKRKIVNPNQGFKRQLISWQNI